MHRKHTLHTRHKHHHELFQKLKKSVHMLYTHLPYHNDSIIVKTDAHRKTHEERKQEGKRRKTSLTIYLPLTLLQGLKRVTQSLHVRGCWRLNINFIF